ncbi:capsular polysaccharide biosynthesis protein [Emticicia oligotrophica DSM 17448]|uniref:protein-tyrosine-phosphatase n=1 Tax=Emticicia oligotrophica (strain DSM 17448 / CIP 109782 / MTCC 6937 / GPTSA100-15) TaxID=929562 RepID=A0ABM5N7M9_EMTOG|nr:CpsB/CapC family capsule biosynthesis tyrosine phosphatase [Emticicia oligotrophica]AFK05407.1 capsular polysaccharide biosynthesis protein [Emticicia oligotrophica DSM 17448]
MFSFFKKKPQVSFAEMLKVDMHSHLIPGIDDGSPNIETSIQLIESLKAIGYQKIITTPHIMNDFHPNTSEIIINGLASLKNELESRKMSISIEAAAEYYLDADFEKLLLSNDILCFGSKKYVLIEMSFVAQTPNLEEIIFNLLMKGYQPILAHPERYNYWHNTPKIYKHIHDIGCLLQVNMLSLLGYYGKPTKNVALNLIKSELVDFLGTDLHHDRHLQVFIENTYNAELNDLIEKYPFKNASLI